jgi:UDP-2,3-diacylglucosamine pyrophosphatase LpxH
VNAPLRIDLPPKLRSVFISDVHLGSANCHADALADFLHSVRCDRLYLVGDIFDLWWMSERRASWGADHTRILECLHGMRRGGTELVYIPGNHDRPIRRFVGLALPRMTIRRRAIHQAADGRRYLVTHGDEFDGITHFGGFQEWLGDKLYDAILAGNRVQNRLRRAVGGRYWSLADFLKRRSAAAERYIGRYVAACLDAAARRGLDGIISGHIHRPALLERDGLVYANDGDWVESLTALTEDASGALSLVRWNGRIEVLARMPARDATALFDLPRAA